MECQRAGPGDLAEREEQDLEKVVIQLDITAAALHPPVPLYGQVTSEPDSVLKNAICLLKDRESSSWRRIAAANRLVLR